MSDDPVVQKTDPKVVFASAEKRFFIDMLTKDIELLPAIADLVDNSVDGARASGQNSLANFWIKVTANANEFSIADNAGGISSDIARNYAFRFGRPEKFKGTKGSVGQFGIGMKRAIFKLGSSFAVESKHAGGAQGGGSSFVVQEDVKEWATRADDWTFQFSKIDEGIDIEQARAGTTITVTDLHPSVRADLADVAVLRQLALELSTRHQRSIIQGLTIEVNGTKLKANSPALQSSEEFKPVNRTFRVSLDEEGGPTGEVTVQLIAGTVAQASQGLDEDDAANFPNTGDAGWYVFCNDRLLLAADRSGSTGWGTAAASYHPQYRNFRGFVYMASDDAGLLPWNTTKTAVDRDHAVFRAVASEMKKALVEVQGVINRAKTETTRWQTQVEDAEQQGEIPSAKTPLLEAIENAPHVLIENLPQADSAFAPQSAVFPPRPKPGPTTQRIQFEVEIDRYQKLAEVFGTKSGSDLGRKIFEYVWDAEVE